MKELHCILFSNAVIYQNNHIVYSRQKMNMMFFLFCFALGKVIHLTPYRDMGERGDKASPNYFSNEYQPLLGIAILFTMLSWD